MSKKLKLTDANTNFEQIFWQIFNDTAKYNIKGQLLK